MEFLLGLAIAALLAPAAVTAVSRFVAGPYASRRPRHLDELAPLFRRFLSLLEDGAALILDHSGSKRFLQFTRTPDGALLDTHSLRLQVPPPALAQFLVDARALGFSVVAGPLQDEDPEVAVAGASDDAVRQMIQLARLGAATLGLDDEARFRLRFVGDYDFDALHRSLED